MDKQARFILHTSLMIMERSVLKDIIALKALSLLYLAQLEPTTHSMVHLISRSAYYVLQIHSTVSLDKQVVVHAELMQNQLKVLTVVVAKVTSAHSLLRMLLADALVATISLMKSPV